MIILWFWKPSKAMNLIIFYVSPLLLLVLELHIHMSRAKYARCDFASTNDRTDFAINNQSQVFKPTFHPSLSKKLTAIR